MRYLWAALLLWLPGPAFAWDVVSARDPLTDRLETHASVSIASARLYVGCLNGQITPEIEIPRIPLHRASVAYRFDQGPLVQRIAFSSRDRQSVIPWLTDTSAAVQSLRTAKRLRIQISGELFDFDISGGNTALAGINCKLK